MPYTHIGGGHGGDDYNGTFIVILSHQTTVSDPGTSACCTWYSPLPPLGSVDILSQSDTGYFFCPGSRSEFATFLQKVGRYNSQ